MRLKAKIKKWWNSYINGLNRLANDKFETKSAMILGSTNSISRQDERR